MFRKLMSFAVWVTCVILFTSPVFAAGEVTNEWGEIRTTESTERVTREDLESFQYEVTAEEVELLAKVVYAEAGNQSYECKVKIASAVVNRVESDENFPDTVKEVVYQPGQFRVGRSSYVTLDTPIDYVYPEEPTEDCMTAAVEVLENGSVLPEDVQVFYADYCYEPWVRSRRVYDHDGDTVFASIERGYV